MRAVIYRELYGQAWLNTQMHSVTNEPVADILSMFYSNSYCLLLHREHAQ